MTAPGRWREDVDRREWINSLRRKWNLVTAEGLPPPERTQAEVLREMVNYGTVTVAEARRVLVLPPFTFVA